MRGPRDSLTTAIDEIDHMVILMRAQLADARQPVGMGQASADMARVQMIARRIVELAIDAEIECNMEVVK